MQRTQHPAHNDLFWGMGDFVHFRDPTTKQTRTGRVVNMAGERVTVEEYRVVGVQWVPKSAVLGLYQRHQDIPKGKWGAA